MKNITIIDTPGQDIFYRMRYHHYYHYHQHHHHLHIYHIRPLESKESTANITAGLNTVYVGVLSI